MPWPTRFPAPPAQLAALLLAGLVSACATLEQPERAVTEESAWVQDSRIDGAMATWEHKTFVNRKPTVYNAGQLDGRAALHARSDAGNSTLRVRLDPSIEPSSRRLRFSWRVPALDPVALASESPLDDVVVRVILTFEGNRSHWSVRDHMLSELAQLITGEPLPDATLIYVWDPRQPVGSVLSSPRTQRIRKLVLTSGEQGLNRWQDHDRDIAADYQTAFGEAPGRLTGVGVMTDSNNTGSSINAWYGPITLTRPAAGASEPHR